MRALASLLARFVHNGSLCLSYSLDPHLVIVVSAEKLAAAEAAAAAAAATTAETADGPAHAPVETVAELQYGSQFDIPKGKGASAAAAQRPSLRGGTPALRLTDDRYLAFMHTVQKRGSKSGYALAAYTFEAKPPFAIVEMSHPFHIGMKHTPYPISLVAGTSLGKPAGGGSSRETLLLSYGSADSDWMIARLDRKEVLAALVPLKTKPHSLRPSPEAAADGSGERALPLKLHLFQGAPPDVVDELMAWARGLGRSASFS